jgi:hypothetical protein
MIHAVPCNDFTFDNLTDRFTRPPRGSISSLFKLFENGLFIVLGLEFVNELYSFLYAPLLRAVKLENAEHAIVQVIADAGVQSL